MASRMASRMALRMTKSTAWVHPRAIVWKVVVWKVVWKVVVWKVAWKVVWKVVRKVNAAAPLPSIGDRQEIDRRSTGDRQVW